MLISKELFVKTLNTLKESYDELERFQDAMEPFLHNPLVCKLGESAREALDHLLVEVCGCQDEGDIFFWWLFDGSEKVIEVEKQPGGDKEVFDVRTPEGLYDYLYYMYHKEE